MEVSNVKVKAFQVNQEEGFLIVDLSVSACDRPAARWNELSKLK